jgi:hypothetical protein
MRSYEKPFLPQPGSDRLIAICIAVNPSYVRLRPECTSRYTIWLSESLVSILWEIILPFRPFRALKYLHIFLQGTMSVHKKSSARHIFEIGVAGARFFLIFESWNLMQHMQWSWGHIHITLTSIMPLLCFYVPKIIEIFPVLYSSKFQYDLGLTYFI